MDWDAEKLIAFITVLAPGFLIMFVRRQFTVSIPKSLEDRAISYAAISAVYFAFSVPLFAFANSKFTLSPEIYRAFEYLVLPIVLGLIFAWLARDRKFDSCWDKVGLHPIHHIPSAWDFVFSQITTQDWILVTLNDGSQVAGKFRQESFASSDAKERDLYVSEVWDMPDTGPWTACDPPRGILLCGKDIKTVELIRSQTKTESKDQNVGQKEA